MALIDREAALLILGKHLPAFYRAVMGAWDDYRSYPDEKRLIHSDRSRASLMHDHMVDRASKYAVVEREVQIVKRQGLYLFVFGAQIAIRYKKFDEDLKTSNQPSKQVREFKNQQQLPGVPAAHNLESGYILSKDAQSVQAVHLVCPSGERSVSWDVLLTDSAQETVIANLFEQKIDNEETDPGARVRRREQAKIIRLVKDDNQG